MIKKFDELTDGEMFWTIAYNMVDINYPFRIREHIWNSENCRMQKVIRIYGDKEIRNPDDMFTYISGSDTFFTTFEEAKLELIEMSKQIIKNIKEYIKKIESINRE